MKYEPWTYEPTRELHDLFKDKFGKVYEPLKIPFCDDNSGGYYPAELSINPENQIGTEMHLKGYVDKTYICYPALTLSSFCEFVDDYIEDDNRPLTGLDKELLYMFTEDEIKEQRKARGGTNLKHFALDNWDKPEKIINEVKKYL
jgi:hypothetical protein